MDCFQEGYSFFVKNCDSFVGAMESEMYIDSIRNEIDKLKTDLNAFKGFNTDVDALKGDIAEFWHSDTFNINAIIQGSKNRTLVDRSHDFASADIIGNWGEKYGLKYYKTGMQSAKQQAKSIFERYNEYKAGGGKELLDVYLKNRGFDNIETILNDPIYNGQIRIIPKEQLQEATAWLQRKIQEESVKRPEQLPRYLETLNMLTDKIKDGKGTESIALTKQEAEKLAKYAKEGRVTDNILKEYNISTEDLISYEYIIQQAFNAGITSATISMVLSVAPEIYKAISYLIYQGEINEEDFRKIGFAALSGTSEGFIRGSVSAALTSACKSGALGEALKSVNPSVIASITVITIDTIKNTYKVVSGEKENRELINDLLKEMLVSTCSLIGGGITQSFIEIPILGFLLGNFIGSVVGAFAYDAGYNTLISFCVDTGFTMFGLVEQNYELPESILKSMGVEVFNYEKFIYKKFEPSKFTPKTFRYKEFKAETLSLKYVRRGVIGVNRVGYL